MHGLIQCNIMQMKLENMMMRNIVKSYDDFTQHSLVQDNSVSYGISSSNSSNDSVTNLIVI